MRTGFTYVVAILDRSSSMDSLKAETVSGFNTFLREQKEGPGEAAFTLCLFSDYPHLIHDGVPIGHVAELTEETYAPNGWTALNDAVAYTIDHVGGKLRAMKEEDRPDKVIVLIMTDGEENRSKKYPNRLNGARKVGEMIKHQREKYKWEFVMVGANFDMTEVIMDFNIPVKNAAYYQANAIGTRNLMRGLSSNLTSYRSQPEPICEANAGFFVDPQGTAPVIKP